MKQTNLKIVGFAQIILVFLVGLNTVIAQTGIECMGCHGMNGNHKSNCPYQQSRPSNNNAPPSISIEQDVAQQILSGMITNLFKNANNTQQQQSEAEKQRQIEEEQRQMKLAALLAEEKRYNDSIAQMKHEKLVKEIKPLEEEGNLSFKPLDAPFTKINFNCKITSFKGEVKVLKANGGGIVTLSKNQSLDLALGDYIATGSDGQVKLHFAFEKGGEDMLLGPNTVVKIVKEEDGTQVPKKVGNGGMIYLTNNKVSESLSETSEKMISEYYALTKELRKEIWDYNNSHLRMRCNTFALAIRGTELFLTTDSLGNSKVCVLAGMVDVLDEVNSKFVTLYPGYMCTVNLAGEIIGLYQFRIDDKDMWWLKE